MFKCHCLSNFASFQERLRPRICVKYFLSFPQKNLSPEKTETNWLFTFQFVILTKTPILPNFQVPNGFFGINVNFITHKLKSKHLVCLSYLWWQVFLTEREKIFYTYSGPKLQYFNKKKLFWCLAFYLWLFVTVALLDCPLN